MKPTKILTDEHRVIEVVLDVLERITDQAKNESRLDRESAEQAVDFIRHFADECHHGKEETHLFTAMVKKGLPREGGPVGQMVHEHEQGRAFVRGMAENIAAASTGDAEALRAYSASAHGYVQLLRAHIQKEDRILFPLADRVFDETDQETLLANFAKVESEHMGEGTHDKYLRIAEALADRYGVPREKIAGHSCGCAHTKSEVQK